MVTASTLAVSVAAINAGFDIYDGIAARQGLTMLDASARQGAVDAYVKASEEAFAAESKAAHDAIAAARATQAQAPEPPAVA